MKFTILFDDAGTESHFGLTYSRESEAWAEFWKQVSQMPDDGEAIQGLADEAVIASRMGRVNDHCWYIHLIQETV